MKDLFEKVGAFNEAFGVPENETVEARIPDPDKFLYSRLMQEELEEYIDAMLANDRVEVSDALVDMLFILVGMFRKHGVSPELAAKLFDEVYKSNMSKLDEEGKPIYREDGKVLKGKNYFKPNLAKILAENQNGSEGV